MLLKCNSVTISNEVSVTMEYVAMFGNHQHHIIIIYLYTKHIHIDGRKDSGTEQQGAHSTLTVGLPNLCSQSPL